jgi:hypothetical protein
MKNHILNKMMKSKKWQNADALSIRIEYARRERAKKLKTQNGVKSILNNREPQNPRWN